MALSGRKADYYSSPVEVLELTNIDPEDFIEIEETEDEEADKLKAEAALDTFIIQKLKEAKNIIDNYCNTTFDDKAEAIHGIARDIVVNIISNGKISRQIGVISIEDYPTTVDMKVFTSDIKERLKPFVKRMPFSLFRVRNKNEVI